MAKEKFVVMFQNLDIDKLKEELSKREIMMCNCTAIENLDEVVEEIEALKFLIKDFEVRG